MCGTAEGTHTSAHACYTEKASPTRHRPERQHNVLMRVVLLCVVFDSGTRARVWLYVVVLVSTRRRVLVATRTSEAVLRQLSVQFAVTGQYSHTDAAVARRYRNRVVTAASNESHGDHTELVTGICRFPCTNHRRGARVPVSGCRPCLTCSRSNCDANLNSPYGAPSCQLPVVLSNGGITLSSPRGGLQELYRTPATNLAMNQGSSSGHHACHGDGDILHLCPVLSAVAFQCVSRDLQSYSCMCFLYNDVRTAVRAMPCA